MKAPIAGTVTTSDPVKTLMGRPVQRGETLLTVMDETGPWHVEMSVPRSGPGTCSHGRRSIRRGAVEYRAVARPEQTHPGRIERIGDRSVVTPELGTAVPVYGTMETETLPLRRIGMEVNARLECAPRSRLFVYFGEFQEYLASATGGLSSRTLSLPAQRCCLKPNVPRPLGGRGGNPLLPPRRFHEEPWYTTGVPFVGPALRTHCSRCNRCGLVRGACGTLSAARTRRIFQTSLDERASGGQRALPLCTSHQGAPGPGGSENCVGQQVDMRVETQRIKHPQLPRLLLQHPPAIPLTPLLQQNLRPRQTASPNSPATSVRRRRRPASINRRCRSGPSAAKVIHPPAKQRTGTTPDPLPHSAPPAADPHEPNCSAQSPAHAARPRYLHRLMQLDVRPPPRHVRRHRHHPRLPRRLHDPGLLLSGAGHAAPGP